MPIDNDVSEAEVVETDPKTQRVTDLLSYLGADGDQEDHDLVLEAFEREKVYWANDLEQMRQGFSIPGPCMAAASVLTQQIEALAKAGQLDEMLEDEGAREALLIQLAHQMAKILGWREVSAGVCGALRNLHDIHPDDRSFPVREAVAKLEPLVENEALES